jgi:frataxin-like iron-binding protein CyaY
MLGIGSRAAMAGLAPALLLSGSANPAIARPAAPGPPTPLHHDARPTVRAPKSPFRVVVSSHFGAPGNASGYSAIVVTGKRAAWAFGGTNPGGPSTPVVERWDNSVLTQSGLPAGLTGFISTASAPSATDIWAASEYGGYVLHWNGSQWSLAIRWHHATISGLTAISASDVWVFGAAAGRDGSHTWHFDGRSWWPVAGRAATIDRASAVSRRDIWAITARPGADDVLHYNGREWRAVRIGRDLTGVTVQDVLARSERNVWLLGDEFSGGDVRLVLLHWNGACWTKIATGVNAFAGRLAAGPRGTVLATATPAGPSATGLILQVSAAGTRYATAIQSGLGSGVSAVALLPGTRLLLASGGDLTRLGGNAVIWEGPLRGAAHRGEPDAD